MKEEKDYIRDIAEIRSMMERSSKFLSLSGWSGIMAGVYALSGAYIAWKVFQFNPTYMAFGLFEPIPDFLSVFLLSLIVLSLALGTAFLDSYRKARSKGERAWNAISKKLLVNLAVPLLAGGILILAVAAAGLIGLVIPLMLIFYGLALYNGGNFTYRAVKILGLVQLTLGLISCFFIEYSLLIWAFGFGVVHIIYGIYMFRSVK